MSRNSIITLILFLLISILSIEAVHSFTYFDTFDNCTNWWKNPESVGNLNCDRGTFRCDGGECASNGIFYQRNDINISGFPINVSFLWNADTDYPAFGLANQMYPGAIFYITFNYESGTSNDGIYIYNYDGHKPLGNCPYPNGNHKPTSGVHNVSIYFKNIPLYNTTQRYVNITVWLDDYICESYTLGDWHIQDYPEHISEDQGIFPQFFEGRSTDGSLDNLSITWNPNSDWHDLGEPCEENWTASMNSCTVGDNQTLTYTDNNQCGTFEDLPVGNGTLSTCNYCTAEVLLNPANCVNSTRQVTYTWLNYNTCCAVTNILIDCNIPANYTTSCTTVGTHQTSDILGVGIDFFVDFGVEMIKYAPLIALFGIIMGISYLLSRRRIQG